MKSSGTINFSFNFCMIALLKRVYIFICEELYRIGPFFAADLPTLVEGRGGAVCIRATRAFIF